MSKNPTKNIVIVDHRRGWQDAIEMKIAEVYPELFPIKVATLKELHKILCQVQDRKMVDVTHGFKTVQESIEAIDLVVLSILKKDSYECVEKCLGSISELGAPEVLDLHLVLDGATNTDFLGGDFMRNKIKELLKV